MRFKLLLLPVLVNLLVASNFLVSNDSSDSNTNISFNLGEYSFEEKDGYKQILTTSKGKIDRYGEPDLPQFSFNFAIENNKSYDIEYDVLEYEIHHNITLYPSQRRNLTNELVKNINLYSSKSIYPSENIEYSIQSLRGYEMLSVSFIPFEYNLETKELKVYKSVSINIVETGEYRQSNTISKGSTIFENMYKNMVINDNDFTDSRMIQNPSILYICGGDVATSNYNTFFKPLVEWRRQQGYQVEVVSVNDIGNSTTSIKNYISNAYYNSENPPEHVCLVGDATGSIDVNTYNASGGGGGWWGDSANGEGDYPYTLLEGNDLLSDIVIGRISVSNIGELYTVVNKIIGYEKNISGETDWLSRAALVGDPYDSGISTVITNEYIETLFDIHGGITDVRTQYSGNGFDSFMRDQMNDGVAYLNYRGFYGFSNFTQNDVDALSNGYKLPFLTTLTCDTGSFETDNSCIVESLLRAGSVASPKGAIAAIGTAQPYTHTAFNNIVNMGMFDGIFLYGAKTAGEALNYGRLALNEIYPQNPNDNVYLFATWNSLMGDSATQLWTSSPQQLFVNHNDEILNGSNNFQVEVLDASGNPLSGVTVTLYKPGFSSPELQLTSLSNQNGIADFSLGDYNQGSVFVTSRCQNCIPVETNVQISSNSPELSVLNNSIEVNVTQDSNINSDGILNPGESAEISFNIQNLSSESYIYSNFELISLSDKIIITDGNLIENISPNNFQNGITEVGDFEIAVLENFSINDDPGLRLVVSTTGESVWEFDIPINIVSGDILIEAIIVNDGNNNGILNRGEDASILFQLSNTGLINLENISASIDFSASILGISNYQLTFPNAEIGQIVQSNELIDVSINQNLTNGLIVDLPITFQTDNGHQSEKNIEIQIGQVSVTDPLGPDNYGYYIYDQNDDYELAPTYDWIEIDPNYGGPGEELNNLNDNGDNGDDVVTVDLPFEFTFYGIDYNRLSICSNGWIAFGDTDMRSFRNYTLPGPGGPPKMVAVFWDDLMTTGGGDVITYYDQLNDYFVVEWSDVRTFYNNSLESFQVILYNTDLQTVTGDDEMKLQYKEFNNNSVGDYPVGNYDGAVIHGQYCTVGIENHLSNDGLQYTFNNTYHPSSMTLSDQTALFITTGNPYLYATPAPVFSSEEFYFNLQSDDQFDFDLNISNQGEEGSIFIYDAKLSSNYSSVTEIDNYGYSWTKSSVDNLVDYEWIDISDDNTVLVMPDNDSGSIANINFPFPFYDNTYSFCAVMANGWISFGATSEAWNNQSVFDEDSPKGAIFAFWDDLNPENEESNSGQGQIKYHSNNDRTVIWYDNVIHWTGDDRIFDFQIVLYPSGKIKVNYRQMTGDTGSATIGIIDLDGNFGLESTYNSDDFMENNISVLFDVAPSWLNINSNSIGQVPFNQTITISLELDSEDLVNDTYNSFLVLESSTLDQNMVIPIELLVSDNGMMLGDINQDGGVDVVDIVRLINIVLGQPASDLEIYLSDLNGDTILNIQDIVLLVNQILSN